MKHYSYSIDNISQVIICGVDGAGKKELVSVIFPDLPMVLKTKINIRKNTKKLLFLVVLDGIHLQNIEEENILQEISIICNSIKGIKISILLVLNKIDLIYNYRKNPYLVEEINDNYNEFLKKFGFSHIWFTHFSSFAAKKLHELLSRETDQEDFDDVKNLLHKVAVHPPQNTSPSQIRQYLLDNIDTFCEYTGESVIRQYVSKWNEEQ